MSNNNDDDNNNNDNDNCMRIEIKAGSFACPVPSPDSL